MNIETNLRTEEGQKEGVLRVGKCGGQGILLTTATINHGIFQYR